MLIPLRPKVQILLFQQALWDDKFKVVVGEAVTIRDYQNVRCSLMAESTALPMQGRGSIPTFYTIASGLGGYLVQSHKLS